jgi:hypothetical protein
MIIKEYIYQLTIKVKYLFYYLINNYKTECKYPIALGCCPINLTEQNYDDGTLNYANHPPVMLAQNDDDIYADPNASINYFNTLSSVGGIVYIVRGPPIKDLGSRGRHGLMSCQIAPCIAFLLKYITNSNFLLTNYITKLTYYIFIHLSIYYRIIY